MIRLLPVFFLLSICLSAQRPAPAPAQQGSVLILGGTAHLGDGRVIENSAIAFENGKITLVADASVMRIDRSRYGTTYDAAGKQVYPGFIAPDSRLGLVEVEAVRATQDFAETGLLNPNTRALIAYNTDSEVIPTVRSNGVLLAQVSPVGGRISGTSSVVQLDAWSWEDAAVRTDDGVHLNWPTPRAPQFEQRRPPAEAPEDRAAPKDPYQEQIDELERFFAEAKAYAAAEKPAMQNPRFESMRGLFGKTRRLYLHANDARAIQEAVLFSEKYDLMPVIVGGNDAPLVGAFLKTHNVPVILNKPQRLPSREDEAVDQPYTTPATLHSQGVLFCLSEEGSWRQRNLPFQAGQSVGYGLPYEAAVAAVTLNAARILGIADRCGSLEAGKDATLFISEGDALDMRTNQVIAAFIQGRSIDLNNKQKVLYRNYESKYRQ